MVCAPLVPATGAKRGETGRRNRDWPPTCAQHVDGATEHRRSDEGQGMSRKILASSHKPMVRWCTARHGKMCRGGRNTRSRKFPFVRGPRHVLGPHGEKLKGTLRAGQSVFPQGNRG
jgi:hypothetical protein